MGIIGLYVVLYPLFICFTLLPIPNGDTGLFVLLLLLLIAIVFVSYLIGDKLLSFLFLSNTFLSNILFLSLLTPTRISLLGALQYLYLFNSYTLTSGSTPNIILSLSNIYQLYLFPFILLFLILKFIKFIISFPIYFILVLK